MSTICYIVSLSSLCTALPDQVLIAASDSFQGMVAFSASDFCCTCSSMWCGDAWKIHQIPLFLSGSSHQYLVYCVYYVYVLPLQQLLATLN